MIATTTGGSVADLPDGFGTWPEGARRAYLEAAMGREALLELVASRAGLDGSGTGTGRLTKYDLACVAVELGGDA